MAVFMTIRKKAVTGISRPDTAMMIFGLAYFFPVSAMTPQMRSMSSFLR